MSIADSPELLSEYVRHLGGEPIPHRTFGLRFHFRRPAELSLK